MADLPDLPISYSSRKEKKFNAIRISFGDGYSERFVRGINNQRMIYSVTWNSLSETDKTTLIEFFENTNGTESFTWQPPGESAPLKWTVDGYTEEPVQHDSYTVTATFMQEFDL